MYQAVLFDMDGVVVDTEQSVADFWQDLASSEGYSLTEDDLDRHVYGCSAVHTLRELFPQISPDRYGGVFDRLQRNQESLRYTAIPGVRQLFRALHRCHVPLALVTGAQYWKVTAVLRQLEFDEIFHVVVHADDVAAGKPDPACYLLAAERLAVDIAGCLVFEDAVSGVMSAVAAGASCVALAPEKRAEQVSRAGAMAIVRDLREVVFSVDDRVLRVPPELTLSFSPSARTGFTSRSS
jgi:HAD superfamily hydrolase (TIGR01509 family)